MVGIALGNSLMYGRHQIETEETAVTVAVLTVDQRGSRTSDDRVPATLEALGRRRPAAPLRAHGR